MGAYGSPELYPSDNNRPTRNKNFIYCQNCGFQYSKKLSKCPECGRKTPLRLYTKWWFWAIAAFVFFMIFPTAPMEDSDFLNDFLNTETTNASKFSEEEFKQMCVSIPYDDLERNPNEYEGKYAVYTGQVVQVCSEGASASYRVSVGQGLFDLWIEDIIYVEYSRKSKSEPRVLEGDMITFYGTVRGLKSYTSVEHINISIPFVEAEYITIN